MFGIWKNKELKKTIADTNSTILEALAISGINTKNIDLNNLIDLFSNQIGKKAVVDAGDKVFSIGVLSLGTSMCLDLGKIVKARMYFNCIGVILSKHFNGQMESYNNYQKAALDGILRDFETLEQELKSQEGTITSANPNSNESLVSLVKKAENSQYGIFAEINNDLGDFINNNENCSPELKMSYAYARRFAVAGLYLQGLVEKELYDHVKTIFVGIQNSTGQSIDFQESACNQAVDLVKSYTNLFSENDIRYIVFLVENGIDKSGIGEELIPVEKLSYIIKKMQEQTPDSSLDGNPVPQDSFDKSTPPRPIHIDLEINKDLLTSIESIYKKSAYKKATSDFFCWDYEPDPEFEFLEHSRFELVKITEGLTAIDSNGSAVPIVMSLKNSTKTNKQELIQLAKMVYVKTCEEYNLLPNINTQLIGITQSNDSITVKFYFE